jgi:hypothetical protein
MKQGSYATNVDFPAFKVASFSPNNNGLYFGGCGSGALGVLAGKTASGFDPCRYDWPSRIMTSFLRKNGFSVARLTERNLTSGWNLEYPVGRQHVVLASIKMSRGEGSWIVIHNGTMYHNQEATPLRPYEFINHPITDAYLVSHPSWKMVAKAKPAKASKPANSAGEITVSTGVFCLEPGRLRPSQKKRLFQAICCIMEICKE